MKIPAIKPRNTSHKNNPKTKPAAAKATILVAPAISQIKVDGKNATKALAAITASKTKFKSVSTRPTSKDTKICRENKLQAFFIALVIPLPSTTI